MFASVDFITTVAASTPGVLHAAMGVINDFPGMKEMAGLTSQALAGIDTGSLNASKAMATAAENFSPMAGAGVTQPQGVGIS